MTVDSVYFPVDVKRHASTEYPFEIESIGDAAMKVYIKRDTGEIEEVPDVDAP